MVDLHIHSPLSPQGLSTPIQLVKQCQARKLGLMSVTDQNCARANRAAERAAWENGIAYISGIELDSTYEGMHVSVLGYRIDYDSPDFARLERHIDKLSFKASLEILEKTQVLGFHLTECDMWEASKEHFETDSWNGELFARVLLSNPKFREHPLLKPYRTGGSRSDHPLENLYQDYYAAGKVCHADTPYPDIHEILDLIHQNHGVAVLAHPGLHLYKGKAFLLRLLTLEIDGLEAYSSCHTPAEAAYFAALAKEQERLITCGSDYQGNAGASASPGDAVFAPDMDPEQETQRIAERLLSYIFCNTSHRKRA